jgi:membrane-associated phospholipid phosphatase
MTGWGVVAGVYGLVLATAAFCLPIARRHVAAAACVAYSLVALGSGTLVSSFWIQLLVPGALLLGGYWLSGFFFRDPQPWLERYLLQSDARVFRALGIDSALARAPQWVLELLEASYAADYVVVGAGAIIAAFAGVDAVTSYWTLVLAAELSCYVALPWLRSRPPRVLEGPGIVEARGPRLRRLNVAILNRASVQANTLPSGHVAGAVAAAGAVMAVWPGAGVVLMGTAALIAVSAVAGRYHYVVDVIAGAAVGAAAVLVV